MSSELLPCPFCGGDRLHVDYYKNGGEAQITCLHCCAVAPNRERWNTRADRTCTFSECIEDHDPLPTCSACGYEVDPRECLLVPGGKIVYAYDRCIECGAKVVS